MPIQRYHPAANGTLIAAKMDLLSGPLAPVESGEMLRKGIHLTTALLAAASVLMLVHTPSVKADEGTVPYPDGYRKWTFLHSSMVPASAQGFHKTPCVAPCTNGLFHFYANDLAMKGLRTGAYPDGAVIAEEMLEFRLGE